MREFIECLLCPEARAANAAAVKNPMFISAKSSSNSEPAELVLYGEVGNPDDHMDAASVASFLRANRGAPVVVRINSFGGSAYDGLAIRNALANHDGKTTAIIDGIAGSAATIIAAGVQRVKMMENASYFIHEASVLTMGNKRVHSMSTEWLRQLDEAIARTYRAKSGRSVEKILSWMQGVYDGTNFDAATALAEKFIDEILPLKASPPAKADLDIIPMSMLADVQKRYGSAGYHGSRRVAARAADGIFKV